MMLGSKVPNYDACGLFRALHSHNPTQYSHIVGFALVKEKSDDIGIKMRLFQEQMEFSTRQKRIF